MKRLAVALALLFAFSLAHPLALWAQDDPAREHRFLRNIHAITTTEKPDERSGESYFSPDGKRVLFQSVRDGQPYYQIYVCDDDGKNVRRVSTGKGKTTCAWWDPIDPAKFIYASTHLDERTFAPPPADAPKRGYQWDYDRAFDIFEANVATGEITRRLTDADGYDAEGSLSHDGKKICFTSMRDGEKAIYVADRDGKNPRRISPHHKQNGGPFFMPGDKEVLYRGGLEGDGPDVMKVLIAPADGDGTKVRALTSAPRVNWCPFPHPDGKKLVFAATLGHRNFELFLLKTDGSQREVRLTYFSGFDALPTFSPDGKRLLFTSTRGVKSPQVFVADFEDPPEDAYGPPEVVKEEGDSHDPHANPHGGENHGEKQDPHQNPHGSGKDGEKQDPHKNPHGDDPHASGAFDPKTERVIRGSAEGDVDVAERVPGADHIEGAGMIEDVRWLADPLREGRRAGTDSERQSAEYVVARLRALGVAPGALDGAFEQPFRFLAGAKRAEAGNTLGAGSPGGEGSMRLLALDRDWRPLLYSSSGEVSGAPVFCGYAIENKEKGWDDFAALGEKLRGQIALVMTGGPKSEKGGAFGADHPTLDEDLRQKISRARDHGAAAVLLVRAKGPPASDAWLELSYGDPGLPVAQVTRDALRGIGFDAIDVAAEAEKIDAESKPRSRALAGSVSLGVKIEKLEAQSRNVIGRIQGTDPSAREVLVLGAHMDHLGWGGDGSLAPGVLAIHPGADDNASGVSALLAVARALVARPLKHDVLLVAFGAEELGLIGSQRFCERPVVALERDLAMINMDMVGRLGKEPLVLGGFGTAKEWPEVAERAARACAIDVATSRDGFGPSDHASFYVRSVPVFFLFTRSHADYHKPTDTPEKIDVPGLERCARFALALAREIDALPHRPTFTKVQGSAHAGGGDVHVATGEKSAYFGSVPNYTPDEDGAGVKLDGATPGSPAEKAGIKSGDVVVEFAGRSVKNIYDYTNALRGSKPGDKVKVVVLREGKRVELEATLGAR